MLISTNILRDENIDFDYIVTENSQKIFESIHRSKGTGQKCFNLIGSYGTGKSSFLLALEQTLRGTKLFFDRKIKKVEDVPLFIKLIGTPISIREALAEELKLSKNSKIDKILDAIEKKQKSGREVFVLVDELGKFIEYALNNNPKEETYIFQRIAEFFNDASKSIFWIGTLHQNIDRYATEASEADSLEWEKVSGRFITLNFNEPPTTLLELIAKKIDKTKSSAKISAISKANKLIADSKLIPDGFIQSAERLKKECSPFDALTSFLAISVLQKYGQNERSIFTFLSAQGPNTIYEYPHNFYNPTSLFDYSVQRLGHVLFSNNNPDKLLWEAAERALQRADSHKEIDPASSRVAMRTILLTTIFSREGSKFTEEKLKGYITAVCGDIAKPTVSQLIDKNIIQFLKHRGKMVFVEGTDVNIKSELNLASKKIASQIDYSSEIVERISLVPTLSRAHLINTGAPRFIYYNLHSENNNSQEVEGNTNCICHIMLGESKKPVEELKSYPEIYVHIVDKESLDSLMREILLYEIILEKYQDDLVVKQLVANERDHVLNNLNQSLREKCFANEAKWMIPSEKDLISISSETEANQIFASVFDRAYHASPMVQNELINRAKLSVPINSARKTILRSLENRFSAPDLGFTEDKFPAQKSIFLSTWTKEGMYDFTTGELKNPDPSSSYSSAWAASEKFLEETISGKTNIKNLFDSLEKAPFGMKRGFLNYWIPLFLITKEDEFALYYGPEDKYLPYLSIDIFDSIIRKPEDFLMKKFSFSGVSKAALNQYRDIAQVDDNRSTARSTYLGIFTNFILLHRDLNKYALSTNTVSKEAMALREAIGNAPDPETALFDTIPSAIGFPQIANTEDEEIISNYFKILGDKARELAGCYTELLKRIEATLLNSFGVTETSFTEIKSSIIHKLEGVESSLLKPHLRVIYERLVSPLDDQESWIKSVADAMLGYSLDSLTDDTEMLFHKNLTGAVHALISHKNLINKPKGSLEISFTTKEGERLNRYVKEATLAESSKLSTIVHELTSEEKLQLISIILETESKSELWEIA